MSTKRHRSAVDGQFVSAEQAKADPERTVSEQYRPGSWAADMLRSIQESDERKAREKAELLARIEALEAAVAELRAAKGNNDNN